jgi:hypothetical protein
LELEPESLVVPEVNATEEAGRLMINLPKLWESANLAERRKLVTATLDAVYVDAKEAKSIIAIKPKPPFVPIFQVAAAKQDAEIKIAKNGLLLFDGSLTSGTFDTPVERMREILTAARKHGNIVLAFSKATCLRVNGYLITDLLSEHEPPYLLETTGLRFKPPTVLLGDVYVARLNKANLAFRLDIDREIPFSERITAMERLVGNDVFQSYPETLRLAHILCTFTANEVLAIQHFITRKHGIQIINRPDMHRMLFGPFGKGEGYA